MIEVREITSDREFQNAFESIGDMDPPGVYVGTELVAVALSRSHGETLCRAFRPWWWCNHCWLVHSRRSILWRLRR